MVAETSFVYGWWVIFPIVGMVCMLLMMSRMFGFRHRGSKGRMGPMRMMGPMGMMGDHGGEHETADDSALEVLGRRYAAGELTDAEFDTKRRRLEGG